MTRRAFATLGAGRQSTLLRVSGPSFARYCQRWGYDYFACSWPVDFSRPVAWSKIALLRALLDSYDTVVWMDADAVIVDHGTDIGTETDNCHFLSLVEHEVEGKRNPNTGVVLLRSCDEARDFLDQVWEKAEYLHHRWWEQAAVMDVLGYDVDSGEIVGDSPHRSGVAWLSKRWNSIPDDPVRNPYVRHYPGWTVSRRLAYMTRDALRFRAGPPQT
ncbi:MAG: putative nucleotide-diphospho-sugar transferase [Solirubrobacterales bacterium]